LFNQGAKIGGPQSALRRARSRKARKLTGVMRTSERTAGGEKTRKRIWAVERVPHRSRKEARRPGREKGIKESLEGNKKKKKKKKKDGEERIQLWVARGLAGAKQPDFSPSLR